MGVGEAGRKQETCQPFSEKNKPLIRMPLSLPSRRRGPLPGEIPSAAPMDTHQPEDPCAAFSAAMGRAAGPTVHRGWPDVEKQTPLDGGSPAHGRTGDVFRDLTSA